MLPVLFNFLLYHSGLLCLRFIPPLPHTDLLYPRTILPPLTISFSPLSHFYITVPHFLYYLSLSFYFTFPIFPLNVFLSVILFLFFVIIYPNLPMLHLPLFNLILFCTPFSFNLAASSFPFFHLFPPLYLCTVFSCDFLLTISSNSTYYSIINLFPRHPLSPCSSPHFLDPYCLPSLRQGCRSRGCEPAGRGH